MSETDGEWVAMENQNRERGRSRYPPVLTATGSRITLSLSAFEEMGRPERVTFFESEGGLIGLAAGGDGDASRSAVPKGEGATIRYAGLRRRLNEDGDPTRYRLTHDPDAGLWVLDPEEPWEPGDGE